MGAPGGGVGYVKRNAIAGRRFASWEAFEAGVPMRSRSPTPSRQVGSGTPAAWGGEAHLAAWERDVANARVHGTTGEAPLVRFARDEAAALKPVADRPPFRACRMMERRVRNDCAATPTSRLVGGPGGRGRWQYLLGAPPGPAGPVSFGDRIKGLLAFAGG